ncbi:MAG: alpha/beta hydrolase [Actinomycetota bacterium]
MGWVLLTLGLIGLVHAVNALAPRKRPPVVFVWSFFASWLTIELVWHHLLFGIAISGVLIAGGALEETAGVAGATLMAITLVVLASIAWTTRRTVVSMRGALAELDPGPDAPRFPRLHIAFPFLMGHRRGVKVRRNITFARVGGKTLRLDVTVPSAPAPGGAALRPALMQIHGGGWVIGDKREQGLPLLGHMAAQGWVGFNVNYRLSPGVAFPDHLIDLKRGLAWIREHAADFDVDPDFICVTGGSAGGHLAALMALTQNESHLQPGFEHADTSLAAAVPFYGVYDFTPEGAFGADADMYRKFLEPVVMKAFLEEDPHKFRDASPVHHVHAGAPPFLVIHGDRDTLAPVEDARAFVERLRAVSAQPVVYAEMQGAQHAFEIFPSVRAARVIEGVERFLTTLWTSKICEPSRPNADRQVSQTLVGQRP